MKPLHDVSCRMYSLFSCFFTAAKNVAWSLSFTLQVLVDLYFAFKNKCRKSLYWSTHDIPCEVCGFEMYVSCRLHMSCDNFSHVLLYFLTQTALCSFGFLSSMQSVFFLFLTIVVPSLLNFVVLVCSPTAAPPVPMNMWWCVCVEPLICLCFVHIANFIWVICCWLLCFTCTVGPVFSDFNSI